MAPAPDDVALVGDEAPIGHQDVAADGEVANPRTVLWQEHRSELTARFGQGVRFNQPLRRYTTNKTGGPADALFRPVEIGQLVELIRWATAAGVGLTVIGGGSNLLIRDGGIRGVVLATDRLRQLSLLNPTTIRAEAGVSTSKILALALRSGLGGVEFLGGVPGSLGGGLIMNAGTYLGEFKDVVHTVTSVRLDDGRTVVRDRSECGFRYRDSDLPPSEVVASADLVLRPRDRAEIEADVRTLRVQRHQREPKRVASNGSTFKNPPGDYAGRLIEAAGCKGWRVGDAECSPVHANWLVNTGNASASDMLALIEKVKSRVFEVHGVDLSLEVKILGDDA